MQNNPDILVVGAGLVGSILTLGLQQMGVRVLCCDAGDFVYKITPSFDARSIALNLASTRILNALGLWKGMRDHASEIKEIQVSSQKQYGTSKILNASEPLGVVVEMHRFFQSLLAQVDQSAFLFHTKVTNLDPTTNRVELSRQGTTQEIQPKLIVAADGTHSSLRSFVQLRVKAQSVSHHALLSNLALHRPHQGIAYERFTPHGPIAMLPLEDNRVSLVWCLPTDEAKEMQVCSERAFLNKLYQAFGYRLGLFKQLGQRICLPLEQTFMPKVYQDHVVFIGNAAQTLHPVAGQGLNLGLRDVAHLLECVRKEGLSTSMLAHYQALREPDRTALIHATQNLMSLFQHSGLRIFGSLGLTAFEYLPLAQSFLIRYASGFGRPPDLACGFGLMG